MGLTRKLGRGQERLWDAGEWESRKRGPGKEEEGRRGVWQLLAGYKAKFLLVLERPSILSKGMGREGMRRKE